jgi:hypothetical protein
MSKRFHDHSAQPVRRTGEQWDGGEIYVPAGATDHGETV